MTALALVMALGALLYAAIYAHDRSQRHHALLRNYPVTGWIRYASEWAGDKLRQYWFALDWEERPFSRLTRSWIYRAAKGVSTLVPFGSEAAPTYVFLNEAFPPLDEETTEFPGKWIGKWRDAEGREHQSCERPYFSKYAFNVSGMSYGALSPTAVEALSNGVKLAGGYMSTGEGGVSPAHLSGGCDIFFQLGTAKYGARKPDGTLDEGKLVSAVRANPQIRAIEVKLAQGAKPGKGGILPGAKVTAEIAAIRGIPEGKDSISPNRHVEISSVHELGEFIDRVRRLTGLPVGAKFVVGREAFLDEWFLDCVNVPSHCPDYVQVDGGEGGTGAAPAPLIENVGRSITDALPMVVAKRNKHGLTERVRIVASGKLATPQRAAWALANGADFVSTARGAMFALGCIQAQRCDSGRCPTGVTASEPRYYKGLDVTDKKVRVMRYLQQVRHEVEIIAHSCGVRNASALRPEHVTPVETGVRGFRQAS